VSSVDYYVRLEQGRDQRPSDSVLDALARALQLDEAAEAHLHHLARPAPRRRRPRPERAPSGVAEMIAQWTRMPAFVLGRRTDVLASNDLAAALHSGFARGGNLVRAVFLGSESRRTFPDWERVAADCVASLRCCAVEDRDDPRLAEIVGELSVRSEEFRRLWARHDVRERASGSKSFDHPLVGPLTLRYESFSIHSAPGQTLVAYRADVHSADEQRLALLSSLIADASTPRHPRHPRPPAERRAPEAGGGPGPS
jgi:hypothetical protein